MSYAAMAAGVFGSLAGGAGAVMGYIGYRRTRDLKKLDLRLLLRKAEGDARLSLAALKKLIDSARESRMAVAVASGPLGSGEFAKWSHEIEEDQADVVQIGKRLDRHSSDSYSGLGSGELENHIVELHNLQAKIDQLKNKYGAHLEADDEVRKISREGRSRPKGGWPLY
jgi:hypothetical protein